MPHKKVDIVIVGSRIAGAATAIYLASQGLQVLLLDKRSPGSDTLSTHALMRTGVLGLARLGVLDAVKTAETPRIHRATFSYDGEPTTIPIRGDGVVDGLYAPRRTLLDSILVEAATNAGALVEFGCRFEQLVRGPTGRVIGVRIKRHQKDQIETVLARWVIGADGRYSKVATLTADEGLLLFASRHKSATMYAHLPGSGDEVHWLFQAPRGADSPGEAAGIIPTNDGKLCAFFSSRPDVFEMKYRPFGQEALLSGIAKMAHPKQAPFVLKPGAPPLKMQYFKGERGYLRKNIGRGWALVGDSGYFKDQGTAHGISDALRDADLLSRAILSESEQGRRAYQEQVCDLSFKFMHLTDQIASCHLGADELRQCHHDLAVEMKREYTTLKGLTPLPVRSSPIAVSTIAGNAPLSLKSSVSNRAVA
jgi:flavin-dependent dehydrogenase